MIVGVGTDLIKVERFSKVSVNDNPEFYQKIFTKSEISECSTKPNPDQSFAARFAAKESIIKCLGGKIWYTDIIISQDVGRPVVKLSKYPTLQTHLSLTHTKEYASAFAVVEK